MAKTIDFETVYTKKLYEFLTRLAKEKSPEPLTEWEVAFTTRAFQEG